MTRLQTRRWRASAARLFVTGAVVLFSTRAAAQSAGRLPERLSDSEYWSLVSSTSEPGGYFRIADNFTSNEREIGQI
jgi:hypothetical protein